jgi:multicomponent Na+:H+ antiporter subunit B
MTRRVRIAIFSVAAVGLAALMVWGLAGLPDFGDYQGKYGRIVARSAVPQRKATDAVGVTTFDYRGIDTLGEEFILFVSVIGVLALLRTHREEGDDDLEVEAIRRAPPPSESLSLLGRVLAPMVLVLGIYVVTHGHLTPGGGFQGGVVLAAAPVLVYLGSDFGTFRRVSPTALADAAEGAAIAAFALVGIAGLVWGSGFLDDVLPLGTPGKLASSGTIAVLSWLTAVGVGAALTLLFTEFLEELETEA